MNRNVVRLLILNYPLVAPEMEEAARKAALKKIVRLYLREQQHNDVKQHKRRRRR